MFLPAGGIFELSITGDGATVEEYLFWSIVFILSVYGFYT
jgi:hypothetical protein